MKGIKTAWFLSSIVGLIFVLAALYFNPSRGQLEAAMRKVGEQQIEIQHLKEKNVELRQEAAEAKEIKAILKQVKEFFEGS